MQPDDYLHHVRTDGARLQAVVVGRLDAEVPACPGWTVRDLVLHTAEVYEHKTAIIEQGARPRGWSSSRPDGTEPLAWFVTMHERLCATLAAADPAAPTWTWLAAPQTTAFWHRRMAHETLIHRVDAELAGTELAAGGAGEVDRSLAVDGIDEVLRVFLAGRGSGCGGGETVAVECDARRWVVQLTGDGADVTELGVDRVVESSGTERGAAEPASSEHPQAVVRGDPSAVLLWLWGRADMAAVEVDGDSQAVDMLRAALRSAT
jgi:uncharacterized protein (TIGR03083 family)